MSHGSGTEKSLSKGRRRIAVAFAVVLTAGSFVPAPGRAQEEMGRVKVQTPWLAATRGFIRIGGIDGESKEQDHKDWIELISVDMGSGAGGPSAVTPGEIVIVKKVDKSSPKLVEVIAKGGPLPSVQLHAPAVAADRGTADYLQYELENVRITSYSISTAGDFPTESITFHYEKITRKDGPVLKAQKIRQN